MSKSENKNIAPQNKLVISQSKEIRRIWHNEERFYSVVDICGALTDNINPRDYWYQIKKRASEEEQVELSTICRQLKFPARDGKNTKEKKEFIKPRFEKYVVTNFNRILEDNPDE